MTPFQLHLKTWRNCQKCELAQGRRKMCFARGTVPCDVLFIGEAPGESENVIGQPFVGPAGHLMDQIVEEALAPWPGTRVCFTNLVCCIPRDREKGGKTAEPPAKAILACAPRLGEFIMEVARPRMIVRVGSLAAKDTDLAFNEAGQSSRYFWCPRVDHPAFILRKNIAEQGLLIQRAIVTIQSAYEETFDAKGKPLPPPEPEDIPF